VAVDEKVEEKGGKKAGHSRKKSLALHAAEEQMQAQ
jgi:hypothetical protein